MYSIYIYANIQSKERNTHANTRSLDPIPFLFVRCLCTSSFYRKQPQQQIYRERKKKKKALKTFEKAKKKTTTTPTKLNSTHDFECEMYAKLNGEMKFSFTYF